MLKNSRIVTGFMVLFMAIAFFISDPMEAKAYIQTSGTVVSESAVIRQSADGNSKAIASIVKGDEVTINNEEKDGNGVVWYKVFVDAHTLGYVRGDLIQKKGDSAPVKQEKPAENSKPQVNTGTTVAATTKVESMTSQGATVSQDIVRVRSEASVQSAVVTQVQKATAVTVSGKANGSDGKVWYFVSFNIDGKEVKGFIRSDCLKLSQESAESKPQAPEEPKINLNVAVAATTEVVPVESQGATVTANSVRVRSEASAESEIVTQVRKATAVTLSGQANGADGKVWYLVSFIAENQEVRGFIRSDFVQPSQEIVVIEETAEPEEPVEPEEPEVPEEPVNSDYELRYEPDAEGISTWYLYNNIEGIKNKLSEVLEAADQNSQTVMEAEAQVRKQKIVIIVLAIVLVFLALAVTMLLFKVRDLYYDDFDEYDEEPEVPRRKPSSTPRTVNPARSSRPVPRPAADGRQSRPVPRTAANGQQRPVPRAAANGQQRPVSRTAANGRPRPVSGPVTDRQSRPMPRPADNRQSRPVQRATVNGQRRPVSDTQRRPVQNPERRPVNYEGEQEYQKPVSRGPKDDTAWQPKNFMTEDDDMEFEFLNWDGDEH